MKFDFDSASGQEQNEAVAVALGYVKFKSKIIPGKMRWRYPNSTTCVCGPDFPPNWSGDDGTAFELWDEILDIRSDAALMYAPGNIPAILFHDDTPSIEESTWAKVLTKCFLALKAPHE